MHTTRRRSAAISRSERTRKKVCQPLRRANRTVLFASRSGITVSARATRTERDKYVASRDGDRERICRMTESSAGRTAREAKRAIVRPGHRRDGERKRSADESYCAKIELHGPGASPEYKIERRRWRRRARQHDGGEESGSRKERRSRPKGEIELEFCEPPMGSWPGAGGKGGERARTCGLRLSRTRGLLIYNLISPIDLISPEKM